MAFLARHLVRYAAQKLASNSRAREKAAEVARAVGAEAKQIAAGDDKARAAGRAARRALNKLRGSN